MRGGVDNTREGKLHFVAESILRVFSFPFSVLCARQRGRRATRETSFEFIVTLLNWIAFVGFLRVGFNVRTVLDLDHDLLARWASLPSACPLARCHTAERTRNRAKLTASAGSGGLRPRSSAQRNVRGRSTSQVGRNPRGGEEVNPPIARSPNGQKDGHAR